METKGIVLIIIFLILIIVGVILTIYFVRRNENKNTNTNNNTNNNNNPSGGGTGATGATGPNGPIPTIPIIPVGPTGSINSFTFQDLSRSTYCGNNPNVGYNSIPAGPYFRVDNRSGFTTPGITMCPGSGYGNEVFLIANDVPCPAGSTKYGWLTRAAINGENWFGATVCSGTFTGNTNDILLVNEVSCPTIKPSKVTVSSAAFTQPGPTSNFGATICYN